MGTGGDGTGQKGGRTKESVVKHAQGRSRLFRTHKGVKNPDFPPKFLSQRWWWGGKNRHQGPPRGVQGHCQAGCPPRLCPLLGFGGGSVPRLHHVFGGRGLGGEEAVGGRGSGRGRRRGSTAQGRLKVNRLVKEPVAEENHQGEETELEVAEREESWSAPNAGKLPPEELAGGGGNRTTKGDWEGWGWWWDTH